MSSIKDFDKFLSENSISPNLVVVHPYVWNGYWSIIKRPRWVSATFRKLGRLLGSRRVYWIGLSLYWVDGLKTILPDVLPEGINIEDYL